PPERVARAVVLEASVQHDVDAAVRLPLELEDDRAVVEHLSGNVPRFERLQKQLLLHAHTREEHADGRATHPSLLRPPAPARVRAAAAPPPRAPRRSRGPTRSRPSRPGSRRSPQRRTRDPWPRIPPASPAGAAYPPV